MVSKINCGITGYKGVLGSEFIKSAPFKFIKFKGDITNKGLVDKWIKSNKFDLIIHFAAIVPTNKVNNNYKKALDVNFNGTKNLIDSIVKNKIKLNWFFFSSSSHVYSFSNKPISEKILPKPSSRYGYTKLKAENYIKKVLDQNDINYCIGRIFSFTHNKQSLEFLVPSIKNKISKISKIIELKNLNHYRDFLSVKDISKAIYFLWNKKFHGIINIGSGKKVYLKNIAKLLNIKNKKLIFIDNNKKTNLIANISKIKRIGWKPYDTISRILR
jgi:nucleoside-diphosphate-sugar epimerase